MSLLKEVAKEKPINVSISPHRPLEDDERETTSPLAAIQPLSKEKEKTHQVELVAAGAIMEMAQAVNVVSATAPALNPPVSSEYEIALQSMLNREPVVTEYHPERLEKVNVEPLLTDMVQVASNHYFRGNNQGNRDEMPCHQVYLDAFSIDIHPVTNEQFVRFLEYMGGEKDPQYNDLIRLKDSRLNRASGRWAIETGYAKHPVVGVTWYGAFAYANWVGRRLPTEAEWRSLRKGACKIASILPERPSIKRKQTFSVRIQRLSCTTLRMVMASMTWLETYINGVRIGMDIITMIVLR